MQFQTSVKREMASGPQNMHLVTFINKNEVGTKQYNSSLVETNGSIDFKKILGHLEDDLSETQGLRIIAISPLGMQ